MKNTIIDFLGITVVFTIFHPLCIGFFKDYFKDMIFKNPDDFSKFSFKKFIKVIRFIANNKDYFIGDEDKEENENRVNIVLRENLITTASNYIHGSGSIIEISERIDSVFLKINGFRKNVEFREIVGVKDGGFKILFEDILLANKDFITPIIDSLLWRKDHLHLRVATDEFGIFKIPNKYSLDVKRLSYLSELKTKVEDKKEIV